MIDYPAALWYAWKRRARADWPATLAGVMADPLRARLLWIEALHWRPAVRVSSPVAPRGSVPRDVTPIWRGPHRAPMIDQKSRAAGERPDDDD